MDISDAFPNLPAYTRGYTTNNIYSGVPPLMSDGRSVIASYQPEAWKNEQLVKESGVKSNWEYRQYLIHNANTLMNRNFEESANDIGYTASPQTMPHFAGGAPSDLKTLYLSRDDLNARVAPRTLTQEEFLQMTAKN